VLIPLVIFLLLLLLGVVWCGEERGGGQHDGENRRGKKDFVEPLQDLSSTSNSGI
jgi:hypothetical protein